MTNEKIRKGELEVTVLLTVYNGEDWITEAIESALAQERVRFEILVIDDGSTDQTAEIVAELGKRYADNLRFRSIPRSGLSRARNLGFDEARGEFVCVLDADDRMHPLRCWCEVEGLRRHPDAVICFSKRWNFVSGSEEGVFRFREEDIVGGPAHSYVLIEDPLTRLIRAGEYPGTSACTSRLSFSRQLGRYDESQPSFVDGEMWIRAMHDQRAVYCPLPLYLRRVHGRSWSQNHPTRLANIFRALDKAREHWQDYSAQQKTALAEFERRAILATAESWLKEGNRRKAVSLLVRRTWSLKSRRWARALLTALLPLRRGALGYRGDGARHRARQTVPLHEVLHVDVNAILGPTASGVSQRER